MFRGPTREEVFGCLGAVHGGLLGLLAGGWTANLAATRLKAQNPELYICGLQVVPHMMAGIMFGIFAGAVVGMSLHHLLPKTTDPASDRDSLH